MISDDENMRPHGSSVLMLITYSGFTFSPSPLLPFSPRLHARSSYAFCPPPLTHSTCSHHTSRIFSFPPTTLPPNPFYFVAFFSRRRLIARHSRTRRGARRRLINGFVTLSLTRTLLTLATPPPSIRTVLKPRRHDAISRRPTENHNFIGNHSEKTVENARQKRIVQTPVAVSFYPPREMRDTRRFRRGLFFKFFFAYLHFSAWHTIIHLLLLSGKRYAYRTRRYCLARFARRAPSTVRSHRTGTTNEPYAAYCP